MTPAPSASEPTLLAFATANGVAGARRARGDAARRRDGSAEFSLLTVSVPAPALVRPPTPVSVGTMLMPAVQVDRRAPAGRFRIRWAWRRSRSGYVGSHSALLKTSERRPGVVGDPEDPASGGRLVPCRDDGRRAEQLKPRFVLVSSNIRWTRKSLSSNSARRSRPFRR